MRQDPSAHIKMSRKCETYPPKQGAATKLSPKTVRACQICVQMHMALQNTLIQLETQEIISTCLADLKLPDLPSRGAAPHTKSLESHLDGLGHIHAQSIEITSNLPVRSADLGTNDPEKLGGRRVCISMC